MLWGSSMIASPATLSDTPPSSPDVLMVRSWDDNTTWTQPDLVESCRLLRHMIGRCLLQIEAMGASQDGRCRNVMNELGRLNLMLAREDFRSRESARETCRIVGAQLRKTLSILDECAETVRGAAYIKLSSLVDDWMRLEQSLRHFTAKLEEFEGEAYSEDVVYTPIPYSFAEPRPRVAAALASWLSAMFLHAPARLQRTGVKFTS